MSRTTKKILALSLILVLLVSGLALPATAAPPSPVTFTILHTNDFHGQLEASNADPNKISTPGMARTAHVIQKIRDANTLLGQETLLVDAGDEMQGSLLSNLGDGTATGKGIPTIATYNAMGYDVATFGNHEFDWGQVNLANRTTEATYPYVTANIVKNDTGNLRHRRLDQARLRRCAVPDPDGSNGGQGRLHRRNDDRDAHDHRRNGHCGPVLQGPG